MQTERGLTTATVRLDKAERPFTIATESRPLALSVDPYFDVFRRLDPRETPPSIGQIFGEPSILAVLPSDAGAPALAWLGRDRALSAAGRTAESAASVSAGAGGGMGDGACHFRTVKRSAK